MKVPTCISSFELDAMQVQNCSYMHIIFIILSLQYTVIHIFLSFIMTTILTSTISALTTIKQLGSNVGICWDFQQGTCTQTACCKGKKHVPLLLSYLPLKVAIINKHSFILCFYCIQRVSSWLSWLNRSMIWKCHKATVLNFQDKSTYQTHNTTLWYENDTHHL